MTDLATDTTPTLKQRCQALRDDALNRVLNGDMKDKRGPDGLTFVQQIAKRLFDDSATASGFIAKSFGGVENPLVKAMVERAAALNAPKLALTELARHRKPRKEGLDRTRRPGPSFWIDLPFCFRQPDLTRSDMWLPCNRHYLPLGEHV